MARALGLSFRGATWTLGAWCELRQGLRTFRTDRAVPLERLPGGSGDGTIF